jgi:methionyl-tRNA synthetase
MIGVMKMNNIIQIITSNKLMLLLLICWSIIWKGIALWHSARNKQLIWYMVLLIVNTLGILEIIYLSFFRKKHENL